MANNPMPLRPKQDRDAGLPQMKDSLGRYVTAYQPELALQIIERVAMGETLSAILDDQEGMPARSTFHRWVTQNSDLAKAYSAARVLSASAMEDAALDLAYSLGKGKVNKEQVPALKAAMEQYRWSATRRDPEKYAEKNNQQIVVPVQINTALDLGAGAGGASTAEHPNIYSLTAKVEAEAVPGQEPDFKVQFGPREPEKSAQGKLILRPRGSTDTLTLAKGRYPSRKKRAKLAEAEKLEPESDSSGV